MIIERARNGEVRIVDTFDEGQDLSFEQWVATRPPMIQEMAKKWPAKTCYRSNVHPRMHYAIIGYSEDGTVRLLHASDSTFPGFNTYGQAPEQLIPCGCGEFQP